MCATPLDQEPTSSSLAFLFRDEFGLLNSDSTGINPFATTRTLIAMALWSLRESDLVALVPFREKQFHFLTREGLRAKLRQPGTSTGLEGSFLAKLSRSPKGADPGEDIKHLARHEIPSSKNPSLEFVNRVYVNLTQQGYYREVKRLTYAPIPERYADQREHVDALKDEWSAFARNESELHKRLLDVVESVIRKRTLSSEGPSSVDGPD